MTLINTEGMTFIGPGSEWFWTAVSGLVLAVTFLAIYRQLRVQRDAAAIEQMAALVRDWQAEEMLRHRLAVLVALRDQSDPAKLPNRASSEIGNFWEGVAYLVRTGHLDRRLVYQNFGSRIRLWWELLLPNTVMVRGRDEDQTIYEDLEWLARMIGAADHKSGLLLTYDEAYLRRQLLLNIEGLLEGIRTAEEMRAVFVRPMAPSALEPDAPAPAAASSDRLPAKPLDEPAS